MRDIFLRLVVGGLLGLLVNPLTVVHAQADNDQSKVDAVDSAVSGLSQTELMETMTLTSRAFRSATNRVTPSLVTIESYGGVSAVQGRIGGIRKQGEGNTTGIVISSDGYILTSTFNFIQRPPVISVILGDGERHFAKLVGRDDTRKICLLKIDGPTDLPVPEMVDESKIKVGQWAISLGVGYGDTSPAMSTGIISAKNRIGGRAIQTDANISPANYGGPLVDIEGRVLGICVPMNPQSQAVGAGVEWYDSGIGFAVPLADAEKLLDRLKAGEYIRPAFIGIQSGPNPLGDGILINKVNPNSPASRLELEEGDILLSINDNRVNDMLRLKQLINRFEAGETIRITVKRKSTGKEEKLELPLDPPPTNAKEPLAVPKIR
ncbi:MAG: S1C family serine protease [Mariniblastus sp.]